MAANIVSDSCDVDAHLYRNDKLVGARGDGDWHSRTGVAVTECEEGETYQVVKPTLTSDCTCADG